jgi:DUF4097 and DUF4098 domain-containing protein YvlB
MIMMLITSCALAQDFSEKITKEFSFEKKSDANALIVANINGNIQVTGYEGDKILLEVSKTIYAKTNARLEKGKRELQLGVIDRADTIILYVAEGCNTFGLKKDGKKNDRWDSQGWGYNWNCRDRHCETDYDYKMDFTLKVPASINLIVSTINDGNVTVEKVKGAVIANNINGSIKLANLEREADASTINGDVDIEYVRNPKNECRFYSLNGDINAWFQKGLAAELNFESFNGDFYTNVPQIESMPVTVQKIPQGEGVKFKVNGNRYKVGSGGVFLDFETFNGNVYLKER